MGARVEVKGVDDLIRTRQLFECYGGINQTSPIDIGYLNEFYVRIPVGTPTM